jgi:hypothetical protein
VLQEAQSAGRFSESGALLGCLAAGLLVSSFLCLDGFRQFRDMGWRYGRPVVLAVAVPFTVLAWFALLLFYFLNFSLKATLESSEDLTAVSFRSASCFLLACNAVPLIVFLFGLDNEGAVEAAPRAFLSHRVLPCACCCDMHVCVRAGVSAPRTRGAQPALLVSRLVGTAPPPLCVRCVDALTQTWTPNPLRRCSAPGQQWTRCSVRGRGREWAAPPPSRRLWWGRPPSARTELVVPAVLTWTGPPAMTTARSQTEIHNLLRQPRMGVTKR